ncbi:MAG: potassium-transporting ATPase subunit KdpB [Candidatus Omnitrophica bacterium]|nr:potassium-transporting ATPase subunit KdpB [Candidatus Omnitrophota bacterium]
MTSLHKEKLSGDIWRRAIIDSFKKLHPRYQLRNPVMFVVYIYSVWITILFIQSLLGKGEASVGFIGQVAAWLWFTLLFANFSEALAEGRGKAQADALRRTRKETKGKKLNQPKYGSKYNLISSTDLRSGDVVLVEKNDIVPSDGEVIEGIAYVDESAITGESAPVIRESGGDRSAVTGGTKVISDWIVIRITASPGEGFIDRMISLVEGAKRQKTPNEIALHILLSGLTIVFLLVCATLLPFSIYSVGIMGKGTAITITALVALLVCLIPTTIGGLASAIGIAGMDRLLRRNIIAMSGRAVEAAGDVNVLLLDKTGTITLGNREAVDFIPLGNFSVNRVAELAQLASLTDETPEGRSIVVLAKQKFGMRGETNEDHTKFKFIPFTAQSRMSGVDIEGMKIRKGASDAIIKHIQSLGGSVPPNLKETVENISRKGATPLVVALNQEIAGVIHLKDVVKGGIKERFMQLRKMGIKTVMITGDNPLTAAAIAAESGVDDFLAEATPEDKLKLIRDYQAKGEMVAMAGDGTNDAPALAQADVAVAMNTGTQAAREAANMIDLDSNPTKLIETVEVGKQLLMTRGALTTFSIANDVAKYFAIIPAAFATTYPILGVFNIMHLATPESAILSAVIFNALIIIALIPIALKGVPYRPVGAAQLLRDNLLIYGVGGVIAPFIGIKLIDMFLVTLGVV